MATAWIDAAVHSVNPAPLVGVNTTADATDRLAVKSPASLFDDGGGDHRMKINKATAGDTASLSSSPAIPAGQNSASPATTTGM